MAVGPLTERVVLTGNFRDDYIVRPETTELDLTGATFSACRVLFADANRPYPLLIKGGRFRGLRVPNTQQGHWCIGPIQDQNARDYGDITLEDVDFENVSAQCFHAYGGLAVGSDSTYGDLTFTRCVAKNVGGEMFYVKGPTTGNITATDCILGSYSSRTGWASDHTAFAGDGLDFSNAAAQTWDAVILIDGCEIYNLDGYGIVASSNNVTILDTIIEHCWDAASGATNVHSVLCDPYGPTASFAMNGGRVITARTDGGIRLAGSANVSNGTAVISSVQFRVPGDHISTTGRLSLTEVTNDVGTFSGTDPKA